MNANTGVSFPSESSSSAARTVLSDALRKADPVGARAVENETSWRRNYLTHFRRAVEAGIGEPPAAHSIAADGLRSAHDLMRFGDVPLRDAIGGTALTQAFHTRTIRGTAEPETELSIPYRGDRLTGTALRDQLDVWVADGVITPSCSEAVQTVQDNPDWLRLEGDTVVVLGAGAEMGPYRALLRWGAEVVAVDLPRPDVQARIRDHAEDSAGTAHVPARIVTNGDDDSGADLLTELPGIAHWLDGIQGRLVLGNYCYADGATHVRVSMAADALAEHLTRQRPDTALAFLATPTDTFAVPAEDVLRSNEAYARRGATRLLRTPLRAVSGGRLLQRNYPPGADPGLCDAIVPQQGPNYALAKRLQRWRATTARQAGTTVSLNVAPATRTRSVVKNKALAAAYAGAHRFGVEIFDPATSNVLMAALLAYDLRSGAAPQHEPWQDEAVNAAHGGLWTAAYDPRSALGLAAVLGIGALRG
ncbi:hypothetical protein [Aeromicrobium chenweiae]|uniref:Uncharacterized protein n=1 Tax=Aeromicrobium chenweiae TaxID=2079793 RepID=A0A2S0WRB2_9ACTN|nr:hypothetical protein [Aeromicrobium chenweiae]AWB93879.1 hypothetical protein C3E78_17590 [Aeromicrobium chenweiae]TGN30924.1 hypothetical protein E4L97_15005 [Aeromicrobium chenweiae]